VNARDALAYADACHPSVPNYARALTLAILELAETRNGSDPANPEVAEGWYDLELMGHRRRFGHVRTVRLAGREAVEITEPAHAVTHGPDGDGEHIVETRVEVYAAAAVFSLSPSTQAAVLAELCARDEIPF
jgi:hypothetical protein